MEWKRTLGNYCTMISGYFPGGSDLYDGKTLCFSTKYEQYIVDLFSHLPATPILYKIGDHVMANIFMEKEFDMRFRFFKIMSTLEDEGIISGYLDGDCIVTWYRDFIF